MSRDLPTQTVPRIAGLDCLRGMALIAMTVFHFAFDLELFGIAEPGTINEPGWKYFARAIASSFIFLAGFSLFLANMQGINWPAWRWRMAKIAAAAFVITIATMIATPQFYIFWGILHMIAFASLAGLAFVFLPWWTGVVAGAAVLLVREYGRTEWLDSWIWHWTGLSTLTPVSSDYVPVFPWMAPALFGIAAASLAHDRGWLAALAVPDFNGRAGRFLQFMGRNSLAYYLLHQPVMISLLYAVLWLAGRV